MSALDLRALLQTLNEKNIRFILISGVAVGAVGYVQATEDLNLVPDTEPDNLDRLVDVLASLRSTLPTVGDRPFNIAEDAQALRRGANITLNTEHGGLDIVRARWCWPG